MADTTQFEGFEPANCTVWEAMLPDAVDGTLTAEQQRAFDHHVAGCVQCAAELAEAHRGAAWLSLLKSQAPEPPLGLLDRILAETSGAAEPGHASQTVPGWAMPARTPSPGSSRWATARMKFSGIFSFDPAAMLQPRLAMTAAMAFFSIALTLNLAGVRLRDLRAAHFGPSGVRRTVADASASATRQFVNLRVVYQLESRVTELRNDDVR